MERKESTGHGGSVSRTLQAFQAFYNGLRCRASANGALQTFSNFPEWLSPRCPARLHLKPALRHLIIMIMQRSLQRADLRLAIRIRPREDNVEVI